MNIDIDFLRVRCLNTDITFATVGAIAANNSQRFMFDNRSGKHHNDKSKMYVQ